METFGWGAGGLQALNEDRRQDSLVALQEMAMGIERQKAEAAAAEAEREARAAELEAQAGAAMAAAMRGEGNPEGGTVPGGRANAPDRVADALSQGAILMMEGGLVERGTELLESATKLRKDESAIEENEAQTIGARMENQLKQADLIYRTLGTAGSEAEYEAGLAEIRRSGLIPPEEMEMLDSVPWGPGAREFWAERSMSAKDAAQLELQRIDDARQERVIANTEAYRADRLAFLRAKQAEVERHNRATERVAGRDAAAPTEAQLNTVRAVLDDEVFGGVSADDMTEEEKVAYARAEQSIAARAQEILREQRGITWEQAVTRAVAESHVAGDFMEVEEWGRDPISFDAQRGKSPQTAIPMPMNGQELDRSKLVQGRYYIGRSGIVARWDGTNFIRD